jgi:PDZ domain-containing secreted protein
VAALRSGPPSWGDAGIDDIIAGLTVEEAAIFQVPDGYGAINITRTPEDGPSAGKLMARDVIYKIDNQAVINPAQVKRIIGNRKPNDSVKSHWPTAGQISRNRKTKRRTIPVYSV